MILKTPDFLFLGLHYGPSEVSLWHVQLTLPVAPTPAWVPSVTSVAGEERQAVVPWILLLLSEEAEGGAVAEMVIWAWLI